MNRQIITKGIVLTRTNFQEADRIITILTPDQGKIRVMARGVRRAKSKLAGGIELFSVSSITFLPGRKDISTLISTRLDIHYGNIVKDINRTMLGYELLKRTNRSTEDAAGPEYFLLLNNVIEGLNDLELSQELLELWFNMRLLQIAGHAPNLRRDTAGKQLDTDSSYLFDFDYMAFAARESAPFSANHIKLLRLAGGLDSPLALGQVKGSAKYAPEALQLAKAILSRSIRV